ncbi:MAG: UDP-N-acetylmuramoyl-L-alanyl-D-glutamate--2,6-diaminopimelate ligase [Firmicutes bacterium]|nr:UDP-N-acetylmuramoyl-L-alanyl-D-glutamate--2,6-diaminopimelate ligase [Bacillota bacterium]
MIFETDSRKVKKGQVFVAIKGHTVDGHDYVLEAIKNGAEKIVAEKELNVDVPIEIVTSSEEYLKENLVKEYSDKLKDLTIIGVTGTNGKTTTCYLTYQLLKEKGVNVAYLGTIGFHFKDKIIELDNTTPDILSLYNILLDAIKDGCTHLVMEISSHSLSYERIKGLKLQIAAFTNLTEDHLDYHKTMEAYLEEKLKIINYLKDDGTLIVNSDDVSSTRFISLFKNYKTLGLNGDYKIEHFEINPAKTTIDFNYGNKSYQVTTNLTSKFNIYNYLTSLALMHALGYSIEDIIAVTPKIKAPKGRCETYEVNNGFAVVDYAHTPDAVEKVIEAYNQLKTARVITIVGCGGDRDPIKRPIMGRIATEKSDYVILTSDNPRTEDPQKIMNDILQGITNNNYEVELDRKKAIHKGISMLEKNDILLILGKGHEDYQIIGRTKIHFDDAEEILNWKK